METAQSIRPTETETTKHSLEIIPVDVITATEEVGDEATRGLLLRYATLYLNDYLHRLNDREKIEFHDINDELDVLEKQDHIVWSTAGNIEGILLDYSDKIKESENLHKAA